MRSLFLPGKVFVHKDQTQKARFVVSVPGILGFCVGMWLHRESRSGPHTRLLLPTPPSHPSSSCTLRGFLSMHGTLQLTGSSSTAPVSYPYR